MREQRLRDYAAYEAAARQRNGAVDASRRTGELQVEIEEFRTKLLDLDTQYKEATAALAAANTAAARTAASARVAELERRRNEAQSEIDRRRGILKPKCPPDQPLC